MTDHEIFINAPEGASAADLADYLNVACGEDAALRARVEALFAEAETARKGPSDEPPELAHDPEGLTATDLSKVAEMEGATVGDYKLLQQIGEGGFGVVYMADQLRPVKRRVALKVIKEGMDTKEVVARFEAERQALALMDHPNIARVYDAGATATGRPFFVMELVKGIPITTYCDEAKLGTEERLELFIDVCRAVQHAHQKGIIHRDLKPSNVMVSLHDDRAVVKVIDFGVAKATQMELTEKTLFTRFEQFVGTPAYMSPEQAQLSGLDIDTRSDVYSLGVLLYELLTGRTPFDAKKLLKAGFDEMRRVIREDEPPKPSTRLSAMSNEELTDFAKHCKLAPNKLRAQVRGDLDWIVMKALEKDRTRRYDTASGLAQDVGHYLRAEPVSAAAPSASYRVRRFVRRNRKSVAVALGFVVTMFAGIGVSGWQWALARDAEAVAVQNEDVAIFERDQAKKSERRAVEQSEIAEEVSLFLTEDILKQGSSTEQANAGFEPTPDLTVYEAVVRAAEKLEGRFDDKPVVEAAIRDAIADALWGLGEWDEELPHRARALELRRSLASPDQDQIAGSLNNLARVLSELGRFDEALQKQEQALQFWQSTLEPSDRKVLLARSNLAQMKLNAGQMGAALEDFESVLQDQMAAYPMGTPETIQTLNNYAEASLHARDPKKGLELQRLASELAGKIHGDTHPKTIRTQLNLAMLTRLNGDSRASVPIFEKALERARGALRPGHPDTLLLMDGLAWAMRETGRGERALELRRESTGLAEEHLGEGHPTTRSMMVNFASSLSDGSPSDKEEAVIVFERLIGLVGSGGDNEDLRAPIIARGNLSQLYMELGRPAEAARVLDDALEIARPRLGEAHPTTVRYAEALVEAQTDSGDDEGAEKTLTDLVDSLEVGGDDWLHFVPELCEMLEGRGDFAAAEAVRFKHYEHLRTARLENHKAVPSGLWVNSAIRLWKNQMALEKPESAERIMSQAIAEYGDEAKGAEILFHQFLGHAMILNGKLEEAETALLAAFSFLDEFRRATGNPGALQSSADQIDDLFLELYEKLGDPAKSAQWGESRAEKRLEILSRYEELLGEEGVSDDIVTTALKFCDGGEEATRVVRAIVESPGFESLDPRKFVACVRKLPAEELELKRTLFSRLAASEPAMAAASGIAYGGYLEARAGDKEACLKLFDTGLGRFPDAQRLHRYRGLAMLVLGEPEETLATISAYKKAHGEDPEKPPDYQYILCVPILVHWAAGDRDTAVDLYRELVELYPGFADVEYVSDFNPASSSNLPPPDMRPFGQAAEETLRRYPDLKGD